MHDKRVHARVPIDVVVVVEVAQGEPLSGVARDVSLGGMYIECGSVPAFGTPVTVVGKLPGAPTDLRLPAVVRWTKPGGFGVQFGLLGARETHVIAKLLSSLPQ